MRALPIHEDVLVVVSAVWQTTATAVRAGAGCVLIDSPVLPEELAELPGVLAEAGFAARGLLATHGDWDHLLGRFAFPEAELRAGGATVTRLAAEPDAAQRRLREFDDGHYITDRGQLELGAVRPLPAAGGTFELIEAGGHTADGTALWLPWAGVLVCGDYLSPVEIPMISRGGSLSAYQATLARLATLVERAETVVPGHGAPLTGEQAATILAEDVAYVEALAATGDGPLPAGRDTGEQARIHADNVMRAREAVAAGL